MELRRSTRNIKPKTYAEVSDDEEKPRSKRVKVDDENFSLSLAESVKQSKRSRRKSQLYSNYELDSDFDSDYDDGYGRRGKGGRRKKSSSRKLKAQVVQCKIEHVLQWKREIVVKAINKTSKAYKCVTTPKIVDTQLRDYAQNLQALFINIRWKTPFNNKGIGIEEFKKINLDRKLMKNGIVFIWSEKELLWEIMKVMEKKEFVYVENFAMILLDPSKVIGEKQPVQAVSATAEKVAVNAKNTGKTSAGRGNSKGKKEQYADSMSSESDTTSHTANQIDAESEKTRAEEEKMFFEQLPKHPNLEANDLFLNGESDYFKKSKKVLLMFRKIVEGKDNKLELRHQRTSDVFFTTINRNDPYETKEAVYKMIETLLPKAAYDESEGKGKFKMMELWADEERPREGWVSICEKPKSL